MKRKILTSLFFLFTLTALPQKVTVVSPNQKISIALYNQQNKDIGEWYIKVNLKAMAIFAKLYPGLIWDYRVVIRIFRKNLNS
jgi:hypothetical protein